MSFEVVNRMAVGITEECHLQPIAGLIEDNDEVVMAGIRFEHTETDELQDQVNTAALDKAFAQKTAIEDRLGVTLVPIGLNERVVMPARTRSAGQTGEIMVSTNQARPGETEPMSIGRAPVPPQTFDAISYTAAIYVTFKIEPR